MTDDQMLSDAKVAFALCEEVESENRIAALDDLRFTKLGQQWPDSVRNGFGYFRITSDYADDDSFDLELRIERIANPFSVYADALTTAGDSSDWNQCFVSEVRYMCSDSSSAFPRPAPDRWRCKARPLRPCRWRRC